MFMFRDPERACVIVVALKMDYLYIQCRFHSVGFLALLLWSGKQCRGGQVSDGIALLGI